MQQNTGICMHSGQWTGTVNRIFDLSNSKITNCQYSQPENTGNSAQVNIAHLVNAFILSIVSQFNNFNMDEIEKTTNWMAERRRWAKWN